MHNPGQAAAILWQNWQAQSRIPALPDSCAPQSRADGYGVAAALAAQSGQAVAGWKIAATSEAGQKHINVDGPLAGRLLEGRMKPPDAEVPLGDNIMKVAEAEFAFRFARGLPPRGTPYSRDEVMDAAGTLHLSLEVPDSRYIDFTKVGAAQLIADTACASWLVTSGPVDADWRSVDLSAHVVEAHVNGRLAGKGTGKAALGDPRIALTWLVNEVAQYGGGIAAGDIVTTGTCLIPVAIAPGDSVKLDYGRFGTLACRIV